MASDTKTTQFLSLFLRRLFSRISLVALVVGIASTANAAGEIDEVVVTATKRDSTIKDVPFSINAQTQDDIRRSGATNLEEVSRNVAGLIVQNLGPGQSQVAIRGVSAGQIIRDHTRSTGCERASWCLY